jgi:hypothetical protein
LDFTSPQNFTEFSSLLSYFFPRWIGSSVYFRVGKLLQWGPPVRDVSSAPGPPVGCRCPPGGHAASAVPFTTGVRSGLIEAAPLSELTVAPVQSAWPRATSALPLPVLAHLTVPSVHPREPELESTPSRARAPFYSLVARAADRRAPTPPTSPQAAGP